MSFSRTLPSLRLACHSSPFAYRSQLNWHGSVLRSRTFYSSPGLRNAGGTPPPKQIPRLASRKEVYAARNKTLFMYTSAVIIAALGITYAAVPLYRAFCSATGFAGTPKTSDSHGEGGRFHPDRLVPETSSRRIRVHFNADTSDALPWAFRPQQKFVDVLPGESSLAFYQARNKSQKDIIGIATYNVAPDRIAPYFSKVECFCFEEQKLLAGEEVDMPLLFFIDKDMLDDPACRNVDNVVLSYTFFRARRNAQGHLEPDADESVVQESLGFGDYELAKKNSSHSKTDLAPTQDKSHNKDISI